LHISAVATAAAPGSVTDATARVKGRPGLPAQATTAKMAWPSGGRTRRRPAQQRGRPAVFTDIFAYADANAQYVPGFLAASRIAIEVTLLTIVLSWICGLVAALGKTSPYRWLRAPAEFYIWFIRGTPTLIQIFIVYFGFPQIGLRLSPFVAGVLALGFNGGAYIAEIVRSGLSAIPKGQMESAQALGMGRWQVMTRIILPQVFRVILPPATNEAITMVKNTSLLSTITVVELTLYSQTIIATTFRPFEFYIATALIYLVMTTLISQAAGRMERHYARSL
jgi:polar amino acid transport system permease protein